MAYEEMTEQQFREEVVILGETETFPTLEESHIDVIVRRSKRADADGNEISSADWVPTWDLNAGVALAFTMRAGKVAHLPDSKENEQAISASQIRKGLLEMAKEYRTGGRTVGRLGAVALSTPPLLPKAVEPEILLGVAESGGGNF